MRTDTIADDSRLIELAAHAAQSFRELVQRRIAVTLDGKRCPYHIRMPIQSGTSDLPELHQVRKAVQEIVQFINDNAPNANDLLFMTPIEASAFSAFCAEVTTHNLAIRIRHEFTMYNNRWETWLDMIFGFAS